MKKIALFSLAVSLLIFSHSALAALCGPYLGAGGGYGWLGTPANTVFIATNSTYQRGGLSGRAFVGYNFAQFFGIEGGYGRYARSRYTGQTGGLDSSIRYYNRAADAEAKFYLPFASNRASLYVLGGVISFWEQIKFANAGLPPVYNYTQPTPGTTNQRRGRPIYGGGLSVAVASHFTMNAEYTYMQGVGSFKTNPLAVPSASLLTINGAVNFC